MLEKSSVHSGVSGPRAAPTSEVVDERTKAGGCARHHDPV